MQTTGTRSVRALLHRAFDQALALQARLRPAPLMYLFVLGHARSGSSLLVHLLNESPEICALGETWIQYDSEAQLQDLMLRVHGAFRKPFLTERYVADKILHEGLLRAPALLRAPNVRLVFLLREPERSLIGMYANRQELKFCPDWSSALEYYMARLDRLASDAEHAGDPGRSFFCTHADLVDDSTRCLEALSRFLELRAPLPSTYRVGRYTGVRGLGDFSANIKAGRIVRTQAAPGLAVPGDVLARGREAYDRAVARLSAACSGLPAARAGAGA